MKPKCEHNTLADAMRFAIRADSRILYAIAKAAGLPYSTVHRFATLERTDLGLRTASILREVLVLDFGPRGAERRWGKWPVSPTTGMAGTASS